jgi:hypothetical protein
VLSDGIAKTTQKEWSNKIPDSKDIPKTHRVIPKTHTFPLLAHYGSTDTLNKLAVNM